MNTYLRTFELTLTSRGPVFIGSGEKRTAKEYVKVAQVVYFPDMDRLYADVAKRGLAKSFEAFVMNTGGQQATSRLGDWMAHNSIKPAPAVHGGYFTTIGPIVGGRARKDRSGRVTQTTNQLNDIHAFIKDPFGRPYVPGSSVKGLLRSLYLQSRLHHPAAPPLRVRDDRKAQGDLGKNEEQKWLRKAGRPDTRPDDAVNDLFQAVRVADSAPFQLQDLVICQKIDMNVRGEESGLPLFRECLNVRTRITVRVTVDTSPKERGGWPEGARFLETLTQVAAFVNKQRYADYAAKYWDDEPQQGPFVYLGGGAGYRSKTFVTQQEDMAKVLDGQFPKIKHQQKTRDLGVSPLAHKFTKIGDQFYEMGQCELSIRQVGS